MGRTVEEGQKTTLPELPEIALEETREDEVRSELQVKEDEEEAGETIVEDGEELMDEGISCVKMVDVEELVGVEAETLEEMVEGETLNVEERVEIDLGELMARGNAVEEQAGDIRVKELEVGELEVGEVDVGELVSPSPSVMMEIAGVSVGCIIDTGAETSLIPSEVYHSLLEPILGPLGDLEFALRIKGVGNAYVPVEGYLEAEVTLQNRTAKVGFLVLTDELAMVGRKKTHPILLGCNALKKFVSMSADGDKAFEIILGGCPCNHEGGTARSLSLRG